MAIVGARVGLISLCLALAAPRPASAADPEVTAEISRPVALETPAPVYPPDGRGDAVVTLELTVGRDGVVKDPSVESGEEPFIGAALDAVATWRFRPATRRGSPVSARLRFQLSFWEPTFEDDDPIVTESFRGKPPVIAPPPGRSPPIVEVVVRGRLVEPAKTSFSRAEVRELPGAFGDPFRAVEVMPGVTPLASGIPYFFVRGAPPGNVGYFVDGVRVPLLYHLGLGPSVIHPGIVESVNLYAGAYPARYGRFAGGIVSAETTAPKGKFRGEANLRLFDAGALVEAPFAEGRGSVLAGGRYSYAGPLLGVFLPELTLDYWDYQLRSSYALDGRRSVSVFAFGSHDSFDSQDGGFHAFGESQFHRIDLRADHELDEATELRAAVTLGLDRTRSSFQTEQIVNAFDRQIGVRVELAHRPTEKAQIRCGADVTLDRLDATQEPKFAQSTESEASGPAEVDHGRLDMPSRTQIVTGAWADVVLTPRPGITVTPGLRIDLFHVMPSDFLPGSPARMTAVGIDPRVAARFDVSERVSLENSFGVAHQPASFTLPIPGYELTDARGGLQKALQASAAVEWRPGREWTTKLTLFQHAYFAMTDTLTLGQYVGDLVGQKAFVDRTLGHAYGVELLLRRPLTRRIGGYLAYTLSRSERSVERFDGPAAFDHTHVVHAALGYELGAGFRFGARATFYTGIPATRLKGDSLGPAWFGIETEFISPPAPGEYPEPRRAPAFFRLDLRFEKRFPLGDSGWLAVVLEGLNTTLARETLSYMCDRYRCEKDTYGPISIPSVGLEGSL